MPPNMTHHTKPNCPDYAAASYPIHMWGENGLLGRTRARLSLRIRPRMATRQHIPHPEPNPSPSSPLPSAPQWPAPTTHLGPKLTSTGMLLRWRFLVPRRTMTSSPSVACWRTRDPRCRLARVKAAAIWAASFGMKSAKHSLCPWVFPPRLLDHHQIYFFRAVVLIVIL